MPVVVMQGGGHTTISSSRSGPNSHMCLSVCTLMVLNPLFGLVAVVFSCMSRNAAPLDWELARIRGKIAMFISIAGIILSAIASVIIVLIFFTKDS